jgi:hypothetical protein
MWYVEYAALKTQVIHQSIFHAHESNNSDNEYMQILYPCKHLQ